MISDAFKIIYPQNFEEAEKASHQITLINPTVLGFDTESNGNKLSLISLATRDAVYLFQISKIKEIPKALKRILENDKIRKAGVALKNDATKLIPFGIKLDGMIELSDLAAIKSLPEGLKSLYQALFGRTLPEVNHAGINWDGILSQKLINYAANDAIAGILCLFKLLGEEVELKDPGVSSSAYREYLDWLKPQLPRGLTNIINITSNSYGPWSKMSRELRSLYVQKFLELGLMDGILFFDPVTEYYTTEDKKISLPDNDLQRINGLTKDSAINWLFNSSSKMAQIPKDQREEKIVELLNGLIKEGVLIQNGKKIYLVQK